MAAGFWLARMLAFWPLCIESAAAMLPTTLQKSNLCLEEAPELIHISALKDLPACSSSPLTLRVLVWQTISNN